MKWTLGDPQAVTAMNAKCAVCGRMAVEHTAVGRHCPVGAKHRTLGYTQFNHRTVFTPITDGAAPKST